MEANRERLTRDLKAGLTVGVILVPQAVAYASLAGLPPVYGLYASVIPLLVYALVGRSPHLAIGVNAIDMIIIAGGLSLLAVPGSADYIELAFLLAVLTGLIQLIMGLLRLGFMVHLLSKPVAVGFISGSAIVIVLNQVGELMGFPVDQSPHLHVLVAQEVQNITQSNPATAAIGLTALVGLALLKRRLPRFPAGLLAITLATVATWLWSLEDVGVTTVGSLSAGIPVPGLPPLSVDAILALLPTAIGLSLFQFMTVGSLGRSFAAKAGYRVKPSGELRAIGLSNIVGGFFQSMPISASFSRSSILFSFGDVSRRANALSAILVVLTILILTPLFTHVPNAVLAAIIIVAVWRLIDWREVRYLLRVKRIDGLIALLTFITTAFWGVLPGIGVGMAASVTAIMYRLSRPNVAVLGHVPGTRSYRDIRRNRRAQQTQGVLMIRVDASFSFANAEYVRDQILRLVRDSAEIHAVVLDGSGINDLDTTASGTLAEVAETLRDNDIEFFVTGLKGSVRDTVRGVLLSELIGADHMFLTPHRAMEAIKERFEATSRRDRP